METVRKSTLIFFCLVFFLYAENLTGQVHKIDSLVDASSQIDQFSGSILIAKNGIVIYEKIAGLADNENMIPNTEKTSFSIASVGKVFTATLITKFVESGRLKLDEPVSTYLPGISIPNMNKITIHHLLSHTSGLGNYMGHADYPNMLNKQLQIDDVIPLISEQPLLFDEPGLRHEYSNSGFIVLGKILENVVGKKYEEILGEMILKPLSMTSTKFSVDRKNEKDIAIGYRKSSPRGEWESTINFFPVPLSDGGIFTTSKDLLKFDQDLFSGKILQKETLEKMIQIHSEGEQPGFGKIAYGYGLMLGNFKNQVKSAGHNGGSSGYNAEYRHYLMDVDTSYTIIILSNHERVIRPLFFTIRDMILEHKL
jgi:CubicO group peptidase (beta-lactamase class C family)